MEECENRFNFAYFIISLIMISVCGYICKLFKNGEIYTAIWSIPACLMFVAIVNGCKSNTSTLWKKMFENRVVVYVGNISMNLFLFHKVIINYACTIYQKNVANNVAWWVYVGAISISFMVSGLMDKVMKLKGEKNNG